MPLLEFLPISAVMIVMGLAFLFRPDWWRQFNLFREKPRHDIPVLSWIGTDPFDLRSFRLYLRLMGVCLSIAGALLAFAALTAGTSTSQ